MTHPSQASGFKESGRGGMILALGVLSLVICAILGPIAWYMGREDLRKIEAGTMDDRDRPLVQGGMICGIIGTVILAAGAVFFLIWLFFALAALVLTGGAH